jgi:2-keto-4-pentenoate hydratase
MDSASGPESASSPEVIARGFREARLAAVALSQFPGKVPETLAEAYSVQEAAITAFPDRVAGWKIAGIVPEWRDKLGAPRLAGPVMAGQVRHAAQGGDVDFPVFAGGFAAVEAEFIVRLGQDIPPTMAGDKASIRRAIASFHAGVETAGSPFAGINDAGPCAVISDLGNNAGIIVGPALSGWEGETWESLTARTLINGVEAGTGHAGRVMGGPLAALEWLVGALAARGRSLKAGDFISTGMTTGIHGVVAGDRATFEFAGGIQFSARAVRATPA